MNWTYNTPTESGLYFHKESLNSLYSIYFVNIEHDEVYHFLNSEVTNIPARIVDRWLGPVTPGLITAIPLRIKFVLGETPEFFSDNFVRKMIDEINKQLSNRMKLNIGQ